MDEEQHKRAAARAEAQQLRNLVGGHVVRRRAVEALVGDALIDGTDRLVELRQRHCARARPRTGRGST
eukprot:6530270-Prymnesium_polylepis.1